MTLRTTVTLDDDIAAKLKSEMRRTGRPFKETVNDVLRRGLIRPRKEVRTGSFRVQARDIGNIRAGLSLDNIESLLDRTEGEHHR